MDCSVCCEKLNKSNHKNIICNYCEFSACKTCIQKYLIESSQDPHCMQCKKIFTRDFLSDNCTKLFLTTTLKTHRENVLLDREKSLIPETQPYVVLEKEKKKLYALARTVEQEKLELIKQKDNEIQKLYRVVSDLVIIDGQVVSRNQAGGNQAGGSQAKDKEIVRKKFIRKCPITDCKGFLSSRWKCGLCETDICNKCNEERLDCELNDEGEHLCKPENVASMELLNKDTKPCPCCGTMICKISGCDLMWCPDCHSAFSWNKGTIEKGINHNPHYYEYMRSQNGGVMPRNPLDIPCGGEGALVDLYAIRARLGTIQQPTLALVYNIHNVITHIQHNELRMVQVNNEEYARSLRVMYLMGNMSDENFKKTLQQNEKNREKLRDFRNIFQMFSDVGSDLFRQFINSNKTGNALQKFVEEQLILFDNLIKYFNENLKKTGNIYKCVYPGITEKYIFKNNIETYLTEFKRESLRLATNTANVTVTHV